MNRGDKAFRMVAFVHKLCPVIPLHKRPQKDMGNDEIIVKAGVVWSGVGTLAVAQCVLIALPPYAFYRASVPPDMQPLLLHALASADSLPRQRASLP